MGMESTAAIAQRFLKSAGYVIPPQPKTEAQQKARLVAAIEDVLDLHGHDAHSRRLALVAVEALTNAYDEMEREAR